MLPEADRAAIDPAKVRDYLLSPTHPVGRFKARFFMALGYTQDAWELLRDDLFKMAKEHEAGPSQQSEHGQKLKLCAILTGPAGRTASVVSVWIIRANEDFPRFVTAYPGEQP